MVAKEEATMKWSQNALAKVKCPARIEVVSENPLVVLDTAHGILNEDIEGINKREFFF